MSKEDLEKTKVELVKELDRLRRKVTRLERRAKSGPDLKSPRGREMEAQTILDQGVRGFLQKPYEWSALAAEVERVIKETD